MEHALLVALLILLPPPQSGEGLEYVICSYFLLYQPCSALLLRFEARGAVHGTDIAASGIVGGVGRVVLILLKGMNARFYAPP